MLKPPPIAGSGARGHSSLDLPATPTTVFHDRFLAGECHDLALALAGDEHQPQDGGRSAPSTRIERRHNSMISSSLKRGRARSRGGRFDLIAWRYLKIACPTANRNIRRRMVRVRFAWIVHHDPRCRSTAAQCAARDVLGLSPGPARQHVLAQNAIVFKALRFLILAYRSR